MTNAGGAERTASPAVVGDGFLYGFDLGNEHVKMGRAKTLDHVRDYGRSYRRSNPQAEVVLLVRQTECSERDVLAMFADERLDHKSGRKSEVVLRTKRVSRFIAQFEESTVRWAAELEGTALSDHETAARWVARWGHHLFTPHIQKQEDRLRPLIPKWNGTRSGGFPLWDLLSGWHRRGRPLLCEAASNHLLPIDLGVPWLRFMYRGERFTYPIVAEACERLRLPIPAGAIRANVKPIRDARLWSIEERIRRTREVKP